jgi:hypothetical protein
MIVPEVTQELETEHSLPGGSSMTQMNLSFSDDNGIMTFDLTATDNVSGARTTLQDTEHGVEVKTVVRDVEGAETVVVDKVDRAAPPLSLMVAVWEEYVHAYLHNAQAAFNRARYNRLQAEGKPITVQSMCMCGQHLAPEFADIPFRGGIAGLPHG